MSPVVTWVIEEHDGRWFILEKGLPRRWKLEAIKVQTGYASKASAQAALRRRAKKS